VFQKNEVVINMAKPKKFYTVWNGREVGVFHTWDECLKSVNGFPRAEYKSFPSLVQAETAFFEEYENYKGVKVEERPLTEAEKKAYGYPQEHCWCVDVACNMSTRVMEYRCVELPSKNVIFSQGPFEDGTNNVGEFLALVHALALAQKENKTIPIYSDSKTAIAWVFRKYANTKLELTPKNADVIDRLKRAENWLQTTPLKNKVYKWETQVWGEIPADYGRK
jgi:ribonuclease HI